MAEPYSLSMIFGLIGYWYFMNALILSSRLRILDRLFGHDRVLRIHRVLASSALVFALAHAIVKSTVYLVPSLQTLFGAAAILLFLSLGCIALFVMAPFGGRRIGRFSGWDYSVLKKYHNILTAAGILIAVHVLMAFSTRETLSRLFLMGLWGAFAVLLWVKHKVIRPRRRRARSQEVLQVTTLNEDVTEIKFSRTGFPSYKSGQFVYLRFPGSDLPDEEHPFTLSSAPGEETLSVTVKNLGDFTSKLPGLKAGEPVLADGPYGKFFPVSGLSVPLVFLGGGIGVTPFLSMLKDLGNRDSREIFLFWSVRTPEDLIRHEEFRAMAEGSPSFHFYPFFSRVAEEKGGSLPMEGAIGHLSSEILRETLSPETMEKAHFYICGPGGFVKNMKVGLRELGRRRRQIHIELFSI